MNGHPIEAVIFDWAGTLIDHGCMAPVEALKRLFAAYEVTVSDEQARAPMGADKRDHIKLLSQQPEVAERWRAVHGRSPDDADVDRLYARFVPLLLSLLPKHAQLIDGVLPLMRALRRRDIKIGSTTGYSRQMMEVNLALVRQQGFVPDALFCGGEVPRGRPYPQLCLANAIELEVSQVRACVKVDDTVTGVQAGRAAGMWSVGVAVSGNLVGLPLAAWRELSPDSQALLRARARDTLYAAGADFVIDSVAELLPVIDAIELGRSPELAAAE